MRNVQNREFKHWWNTNLSSILACVFREVSDFLVVWIVNERRVIIHGSIIVELLGLMTCVGDGLGQVAKQLVLVRCALDLRFLGWGSSAGSRGHQSQQGRRGREWSRSDRQGTAGARTGETWEGRKWDDREMTTCVLQTPLSHAFVCNTHKNIRSVRAVYVHQKNVCATGECVFITRRTHSSCYDVGANPCEFDPTTKDSKQKNPSLHDHLEITPSDFFYVLFAFTHPDSVHYFAFHQSSDVWVNSSRFPEARFCSESRWCLCVEILNLNSDPSRSVITNCVRAFVQPTHRRFPWVCTPLRRILWDIM